MAELSVKSLRHESNVIVKHVRLFQDGQGLDITAFFGGIIISEDIERGFLTGEVIMMDDFTTSQDSLNGTATVDISFSSLDGEFKECEPYTKTFRVTRYEHMPQMSTGQTRALKLHLASNPTVVNDSIKLMKSYSNTSSSSFVDHCCDILGVTIPRFIEDTLHAKNFVAPNVSPLDMINWIKLTSQSKANNGSDFYFFENKDGIHFKSIDTMKTMTPTQVINFKPSVDNYTFNNLLKMEKVKGYDVQDDMRYGGAGATVYTHDLITKQYNRYIYDESNITRLNPVDPRGKTYERNSNAYVQFWPHNNSYETLDINSNTHNALLRSMSKTLINFKAMNIEITGNVDIKSGDVVEMQIPGPDGQLNIADSGKWLVKKLKHIITQTTFTTQLEVVTDGNIEDVHE